MVDETRMTVRVPDPVHERLRRMAEHNRRSLNAQMLVYLEDGLDRDEDQDRDRRGGEQPWRT